MSRESVVSRLNKLRAGVLGANDGIVSTAGLIVGVAAADSSRSLILQAGVAAVIAGATSMALGEWVSVSAQRDAEAELVQAGEMLRHELVKPWQAAVSSAVSFIAGALLPLVAMVVSPSGWRVTVTILAVGASLAVTGSTAARLGETPILKPTCRVVAGGLIAMGITYCAGRIVGLFFG